MVRKQWVFVLAILAIAIPAAAQVSSVDEIEYPALRAFAPPTPERVELDNGLVLLLLEDHEMPIVDVIARVRVGARSESTDRAGLTGILAETMRTGGTTSMTGSELDEYLDSKAATIEANIGVAAGNLTASFLSEDAAELLPVVADVLRNPIFEQDKIEVAKTQVNAGIARQNDNPQGILFREFAELVYGDDSAYSTAASYDSVAAISREDLVVAHQAHFAPGQLLLGVVGDFDRDSMVALIQDAFGDWQSDTATEVAEAAVGDGAAPGVYFVAKEDMTQSNIAIGHMGVTRESPDYYPIQVFNHVLSGGFKSRLFSNVRTKKGLAYSVRGSIGSNWDYPGLFQMWMTTKTETTGAGIDALLEEVERLASDPITDEEIELAKSAILNSFVFNSDSTAKILGQQMTYEYFGFPSDYLAQYQAGIEGVTREQVVEVSETYIHPDEFVYLVVGPSEGTDKPLSEYGEVFERDITIAELTQERAEVSEEAMAAGVAILSSALEGMGGSDAVLAVQSRYFKASGEITVPQGTFPIGNESWAIFPDQTSQTVTLPFGVQKMIVTADAAVAVTPVGVQELGEEGRADILKALRRDTLMVLAAIARGELGGVASGSLEVDGATLQLVEIDLDGELLEWGVNDAGQVVRARYRGDFQGAPGEIIQTFSDFREVSSLSLPFVLAQTFEGQPFLTGTVETLEINPEIPESAFAVPQAAAEEAEAEDEAAE